MLESSKPGFAAEAIEMKAWIDLMEVMPQPILQAIGGDGRRIAGAYSISARQVPLVIFNRVIGLGLERSATTDDVRQIARHMREFSAPLAQLQIAPFVMTPELERDLLAEGFKLVPTVWAKMGRRTSDPPVVQTDLRVDLIGRDEARLFAATVIEGFGMPISFVPWLEALPGRERWRCYVARAGSETVAAGAMFLDAEAAWLGMATTLSDARRRGGQGALISRRVADAAALGLSWVFTETGILGGPNPSLANMYRADFQCLHERENWTLRS